jgi:hypothetical protein
LAMSATLVSIFRNRSTTSINLHRSIQSPIQMELGARWMQSSIRRTRRTQI